jgi:hypothetical protein
MDHFLQAIRLDTTRYAYYNPHLDRALSLLNQNDQAMFGEAQKEIKTYIELYKVNHGGALPGNMYILYDYLSLTGEDTWSNRPVLNVVQAQAAASPVGETSKAETKKTEVKKPSNKVR